MRRPINRSSSTVYLVRNRTDGTSFQASRGGGGQGQSVEGMGKNGYGIVGAFGGVAGGVATSTDGGKTFQASAVSVLDCSATMRTQATRRGTCLLVRGPPTHTLRQ